MFLIPAVNSPPGSVWNRSSILAEEAAPSFSWSLVGIGNYCGLVLDILKKRGQVFKYVEFVDNAVAVGALVWQYTCGHNPHPPNRAHKLYHFLDSY